MLQYFLWGSRPCTFSNPNQLKRGQRACECAFPVITSNRPNALWRKRRSIIRPLPPFSNLRPRSVLLKHTGAWLGDKGHHKWYVGAALEAESTVRCWSRWHPIVEDNSPERQWWMLPECSLNVVALNTGPAMFFFKSNLQSLFRWFRKFSHLKLLLVSDTECVQIMPIVCTFYSTTFINWVKSTLV